MVCRQRHHRLGNSGRDLSHFVAATRSENNRAGRSPPLRQITFFRKQQFFRILKPENFLHRNDSIFDVLDRALCENTAGRFLHRGDCAADILICPDHDCDARLFKHFDRRTVISGGSDHERTLFRPRFRKCEHLIWRHLFAVNEKRVRPREMIGFRAEEHFIEPPTRDESFEPRHQTKIWIPLRFLDRFNLACELIQIVRAADVHC